jgi:hypothetical protein
MSDFKSVKQLCEENPNLNNHVLSLADEIDKLEKENQDLVKRHIELENSLIELRKYHKEFQQFAATVYDPNKSTYKELEEKVKNFENEKEKAIQDLWHNEIIPLQNEVKEKDNLLDIINRKNQCQDSKVKQLEQSSLNLTKDVFDERRENKLLNTVINFAVGYISATQPHTDKHPMEVKRWLFEGLK